MKSLKKTFKFAYFNLTRRFFNLGPHSPGVGNSNIYRPPQISQTAAYADACKEAELTNGGPLTARGRGGGEQRHHPGLAPPGLSPQEPAHTEQGGGTEPGASS